MNKMKKNKKYHTVGKFLKSNRKMIDIANIDNSNTQIHDHTTYFPGLIRHFNKKWWD